MGLELYTLSPEGKIVVNLMNGPKTFMELLKLSGISKPSLARKLRELSLLGILERREGKYGLVPRAVKHYLKASLRAVSKMAALRILERVPDVLAIVLYGSVAKGSSGELSDLDLLVIHAGKPADEIGISTDLFDEFGTPFDVTCINVLQFVKCIARMSPTVLTLLEGYEVLYDVGGFSYIIEGTKREALSKWRLDKEVGAWLPRSTRST